MISFLWTRILRGGSAREKIEDVVRLLGRLMRVRRWRHEELGLQFILSTAQFFPVRFHVRQQLALQRRSGHNVFRRPSGAGLM